jgi:hypothetical protein
VNRRGFLKLWGLLCAPIVGGLRRLEGAIVQMSQGRSKTSPLPRGNEYRIAAVEGTPAASRQSTPLSVSELIARKIVPLGPLHSYRFYALLDDIGKEDCLAQMRGERNILVISAYDDGESTALRRAVFGKLRQASPDDYRNVSSRLGKDSGLKPGEVIHFGLSIPPTARRLFPVDDLVVVIFEAGNHRYDQVSWEVKLLEVAERSGSKNVIVPCLGRDWRDRHTVNFRDFFGRVLWSITAARQPANLYFSFYSEWPSFELEDAAASLNAAWREHRA